MSHKDVIHKTASDHEITNTDAEKLIKTYLGNLVDQVRADRRMVIPGLGTFSVVDKPERMARNPATGEQVKVPAKSVFRFKASKSLEV